MRDPTVIVVVIACLCVCLSSARTVDDVRGVLGWVRELGGVVNVDVTEVEGGAAEMRLTKDLERNEPLIQVPESLIITTEVALQHGPYPATHDMFKKSELAHMMFLLYQRFGEGDEGTKFFHTYVQSLPLDFSYHPMMWDPDLLVGSSIEEYVGLKRQQMEDRCKAAMSLIQIGWDVGRATIDPAKVTEDDVKWAYMVTFTRMFGLDESVKLVPAIDLLNHAYGYGFGTRIPEGFAVFALEPMKKGDIGYCSYGKKRPKNMLASYGFLPVDREMEVEVSLVIPETNDVGKLLASFMQQHSEYLTAHLTAASLSHRFILLMRISEITTASELDHVIDILNGKGVSLAHERRSYASALRLIDYNVGKLEELLERYADMENVPRDLVRLSEAELSVMLAQKDFIEAEWDKLLMRGDLPHFRADE